MANVAVIAVVRWFGGDSWTILSGVNMVVAVGNLIPVGGSDGSQLLRIARGRQFPKDADDD
jgi:Zn-dependent protease